MIVSKQVVFIKNILQQFDAFGNMSGAGCSIWSVFCDSKNKWFWRQKEYLYQITIVQFPESGIIMLLF